MNIIKGSMEGLVDYLDFTYESGEDYSDGWLPTLDTNIVVGEDNIVSYKYYWTFSLEVIPYFGNLLLILLLSIDIDFKSVRHVVVHFFYPEP